LNGTGVLKCDFDLVHLFVLSMELVLTGKNVILAVHLGLMMQTTLATGAHQCGSLLSAAVAGTVGSGLQ
jgi:hypothetical protein